MHPAVILIPALGLILGPRLWARQVLKQHDTDDELPAPAHELARAMLDLHGLHAVKVEVTEQGDHFDPEAKAVRLSRHHFDRRSLSAATTAAHEVAHALQHASGYPPLEWRMRLARVAQFAGGVGTLLIVAVPVTSLLAGRPVPARMLGSVALGMLGTGVAAQLAALPTELDASFRRALPMLKDGYIRTDQVAGARRILVAGSLTYVAASFAGVLNLWPWLGGTPMALLAETGPSGPAHPGATDAGHKTRHQSRAEALPKTGRANRHSVGNTLRRFAKPLIRRWLVTVSHAQH